MQLYHATTRARLASIQATGLRVDQADQAAKIKGVWLHTARQSPWAVVHTIRKHHARLDDVVVLAVNVPRGRLTRFRTGLWFATQDVPAAWLGEITEGAAFGASASE